MTTKRELIEFLTKVYELLEMSKNALYANDVGADVHVKTYSRVAFCRFDLTRTEFIVCDLDSPKLHRFKLHDSVERHREVLDGLMKTLQIDKYIPVQKPFKPTPLKLLKGKDEENDDK